MRWHHLLVVLALLVFPALLLAAEPLPWLSAKGTDIVDPQARPVVLRGINLGGWLVEEMWMMPIQTKPPEGSTAPEILDHVSLWRTLEGRLGAESAARVRTALRHAWIDASDFDRLKADGFNCIRLPFLYSLPAEAGGAGVSGGGGWAWLDQALDWAKARGIYVILDLHGAPGGQSKDHHTGEANRNQFFKDPKFVAEAEQVWKTVAERYRDHPEVAGYDLLNEPMGTPNPKTLYEVQDRLYKAIRTVDGRHLIFIEDGYTGADHMPKPAALGWHNVVFSLHHYRFNAKSPQDQVAGGEELVKNLTKYQQQWQVPIHIGEFNQEPWGNPDTMAALLGALKEKRWSWAVWTYKVVMRRGDRGMWGLYRNPQAADPLNPFTDSEEQLIAKLEQVRTAKLQSKAGLVEMHQRVAGLAPAATQP